MPWPRSQRPRVCSQSPGGCCVPASGGQVDRDVDDEREHERRSERGDRQPGPRSAAVVAAYAIARIRLSVMPTGMTRPKVSRTSTRPRVTSHVLGHGGNTSRQPPSWPTPGRPRTLSPRACPTSTPSRPWSSGFAASSVTWTSSNTAPRPTVHPRGRADARTSPRPHAARRLRTFGVGARFPAGHARPGRRRHPDRAGCQRSARHTEHRRWIRPGRATQLPAVLCTPRWPAKASTWAGSTSAPPSRTAPSTPSGKQPGLPAPRSRRCPTSTPPCSPTCCGRCKARRTRQKRPIRRVCSGAEQSSSGEGWDGVSGDVRLAGGPSTLLSALLVMWYKTAYADH